MCNDIHITKPHGNPKITLLVVRKNVMCTKPTQARPRKTLSLFERSFASVCVCVYSSFVCMPIVC